MPKAPTITAILTVPGANTTGQNPDRPMAWAAETLQVGIVTDADQIAWGLCAFPSDGEIPDHPTPFKASEAITSIETIIAPALIGQRLTGFRQLTSVLETLTETAIRYGLSQALLAAIAMNRRLTATEVIALEFDCPLPTTAVPLQMPIIRGQTLYLSDRFAALGYTAGALHPEKTLGPDGERIQRFVRQLRQRIVTAEQDRHIAIHLDMGGGLGQLYEGNMGKILGALYGLEQAASPGPIHVQDPLIADNRDAQIKAMGQLCDYLQMRRMSLRLVAGAFINTVADVNAFIQAGAAHMLHLPMARLGSIQESILAVQACQANGVGVLLEGTPPELAAQIALATQPDLLLCSPDRPGSAGPAAFDNEMARTLAWLAQKAS